MPFLDRKPKPKPHPLNLNFQAAAIQPSDVDPFFTALLLSCATSTPTRDSRLSYESTPELDGHPEPRSLHRTAHHSAHPIIPTSTPHAHSQASQHENECERRRAKLGRTQREGEWPQRSTSLRGSDSGKLARSYGEMIGRDERYAYAPSQLSPAPLRASFESMEEFDMVDGYDHYSDARHEVGRDGEVERPWQDYDGRVPTLRREEAFVAPQDRHVGGMSGVIEGLEKSFDLRRCMLFEATTKAQPVTQSISDSLSAPSPSPTNDLVPRPLFSQFTTPTADPDADSSSSSSSLSSFPFEPTSCFQPRNHHHQSDATLLAPLPSWPHTTAAGPSFKASALEAYHLSNPSQPDNLTHPMPEVPYRSLSYETLTKKEFLMALGHYALSLGIELPLAYAERENRVRERELMEEEGKRDGDVEEGLEEFNKRVEEVCKAELEAIERMIPRDEGLRKSLGLDAVVQVQQSKGGERLD